MVGFPAYYILYHQFAMCPCSSVVERILGKDEVGGSIPLEGSIAANNKPLINLSLLNNINHG
jgi:hypothetical protein